jgi:hypothetical protein
MLMSTIYLLSVATRLDKSHYLHSVFRMETHLSVLECSSCQGSGEMMHTAQWSNNQETVEHHITRNGVNILDFDFCTIPLNLVHNLCIADPVVILDMESGIISDQMHDRYEKLSISEDGGFEMVACCVYVL